LAGEWFGKVYLDYLAAKPIVVEGEDHIDPKANGGDASREKPQEKSKISARQTKSHPMATPWRFIDLRGF
jgi:hypothetical protein